MKDFKYFTNVLNMSDFEVAHFIDTAIIKLDDFQPAWIQLNRIGDPKQRLKILDFGCGIGRNAVGMLELSDKWQISGYDNPNMLARGKLFYGARLEVSRYKSFDDWDKLLAANPALQGRKPFDVIFCSLVLQHLSKQQLKEYFADFARLTDKLFVCGRRGLDDGWNTGFTDVWQFIMENKFAAVELEPGLAAGTNPDDHHYGIFKPKE